MSEYRTTATLTAEVTVRYEAAPKGPPLGGADPIKYFYEWLEQQPPRPSTWEAEQAMLRQLRDERD